MNLERIKKRYMNTANKITISRIIISIIIVILLLFPFNLVGLSFPTYLYKGILIELKYAITAVLYLIAVITDLIDGYIARKKNEITTVGKILDSIADKMVLYSSLIILASRGFVSSVIPIIVISCDTIIDGIKMGILSKGKVVPSLKINKLRDMSMAFGIVLAMIYNLPFELYNIHLDAFLIYFGTIMWVFAVIDYYKANINLLKPQEEEE